MPKGCFGGIGANWGNILIDTSLKKKSSLVASTDRIGSGVVQVARGGSGATAPLRAARPVCKGF